ncbi:MAG: hypothetical protein IPH13_07985 [Planctomycetes bacterium]|nr:hypothetical protein [Planctomycetota bacterium]MCC7169849.1 hypothetical protein [Planctomycetota bacterium]
MDALSEGKLLAAGCVSSGVIHEVANLLTVIDGQIQIREMGGVSPRPGRDPLTLLQSPAQKCRDVVDAFRACFAFTEALPYPTPWESEVRAIVPLIHVRLRARQTQIEVPDGSSRATMPGASAGRVRIAILCALLGMLEHARHKDRYPTRLRMRLNGGLPPGVVFEMVLSGFVPAPAGDTHAEAGSRMVEVAERVLAGTVYTLRLSQVDGEATIAFVAAAATS